MSRFLIGVVVGALGAYAAAKLIDKDVRDEWYAEAERIAGKAKDRVDDTIITGRGKVMRTAVKARQEIRKGRRALNETAGDIADKLSEDLAELGAKAKANAAKAR